MKGSFATQYLNQTYSLIQNDMPHMFVVVNSVSGIEPFLMHKVFLDLPGENQPTLQGVLVAIVTAVFPHQSSSKQVLHFFDEDLKIHLEYGVWLELQVAIAGRLGIQIIYNAQHTDQNLLPFTLIRLAFPISLGQNLDDGAADLDHSHILTKLDAFINQFVIGKILSGAKKSLQGI
jgi:hypothetical protein